MGTRLVAPFERTLDTTAASASDKREPLCVPTYLFVHQPFPAATVCFLTCFRIVGIGAGDFGNINDIPQHCGRFSKFYETRQPLSSFPALSRLSRYRGIYELLREIVGKGFLAPLPIQDDDLSSELDKYGSWDVINERRSPSLIVKL
jgi:hypothetical protein